MKKIISALALATLSASAFAAGPANNDGAYYGGISIGNSEYDVGSAAPAGTVLDDSNTAFKLFGGAKINHIFSVEAQYANLGKAKLTGSGTNSSVTTHSFGVAGVAGFQVNNVVRPFAKIGLHYFDDKANNSGVWGFQEDSGIDLFYGAGVEFALDKKLSARVELERYDLDSSSANVISAGISYKF